MFKFLIVCLLSFPLNGFSTTVLRSNDILFYNGDTLFLSKIFTTKILKKVRNQEQFKLNSNPKKSNQYTAFWTLKDSNLYLVKVLNKVTFDWKHLKKEDSLDLKKAFKGSYKNSEVKFNVKNESLFAYNRFVIRYYHDWVPTYFEDYTFEFKEGKFVNVTTSTNYIDQKNRLNRFTKLQLEMSLYKIIEKTSRINVRDSTYSNFEISIQLTVNAEGKFKKLEFIRLIGIKKDESKIEIDKFLIGDYVNFDKTIVELKKISWDRLINAKDDVIEFSFKFSVSDKTIFDKYYGSTSNPPLENEFKSLPIEIQRIFY